MVKRVLIITTEMHARHWYRLKSFLPYLARRLKLTIIDYANMVNSRTGYNKIFESITTLLKNPADYLWSIDNGINTTTSFLPTDYGKLLCTMPIGTLLKFKLREKLYDAILASPLFAGILALHASDNIPIVYEDVDRFYEFYKNPFMKLMVKSTEYHVITNSNYVIAVSDILFKEDLHIRGDKRVSLIPNGVNLELINEIMRKTRYKPNINNRTIVYAGAIEEWAGIDKLVEAFSIATRKEHNLRLVIIGDLNTAYGSYIIKLIKELDIKEKVYLAGRRPYNEVIMFLSKSSVGVALFKPSNLTNKIMVPLKILEYAAVGLPFIASNVGSLKKIVDYYNSGIVVEYDDVEGISENILLLINNERLWTYLSSNAKLMARDFDVKRLAQRELEIIDQVAEGK